MIVFTLRCRVFSDVYFEMSGNIKEWAMKTPPYRRRYTAFALCGLSCGLCPMFHIGETTGCPGCGGEGAQKCGFVKCALERGSIEYCFECEKYTCEKYDGFDEFDSFLIHRNVHADFAKAKQIGLAAFQAQMDEKVGMLHYLLKNFNDGRRKTFFCVTVTLLELDDLKTVLEQIKTTTSPGNTIQENAAIVTNLFQAMAETRNIVLKLNRMKRLKKKKTT